MAVYYVEERQIPGLVLIPSGTEDQIVWEKPIQTEPLVQVKLTGDRYPNGFSQGRTMRGSESTQRLRYLRQERIEGPDGSAVKTYLAGSQDTEYIHELLARTGSPALEVRCEIRNCGSRQVVVEMLSSFTLGTLTPFCERAEEGRLRLHQIRSTWSAEGRLVSRPVEEYQLEPSWQCYSANGIRFGQLGSMPVREYAPLMAAEDVVSGVFWAVGLSQGCSWQLEASRKDEALVLSGGLADREFGHWMKTLEPGESFQTPKAVLTCVKGPVDRAFGRLADNMRSCLRLPSSELDMPVLFNEFCTTWGHPNEETVKELVQSTKELGIGYFVIDAGWYIDDDAQGDTKLGEWNVGEKRFPSGMKACVDRIRAAGMVPGIWFEFEIAGEDSLTFNMADRLLKRDGVPITAGKRRFWDMRQECVQEYLFERVISFLKENGFGYLKIDYNGNIGIGCEGAESLGEGLRQQVEATVYPAHSE